MARRPDGKFSKGNPGGPGRPRRAVEADYLRALADACPADTWRLICDRAVADALDGDPKARAWLADYLLGTPQPGQLQMVAVDELLGADPVVAAAEEKALLSGGGWGRLQTALGRGNAA